MNSFRLVGMFGEERNAVPVEMIRKGKTVAYLTGVHAVAEDGTVWSRAWPWTEEAQRIGLHPRQVGAAFWLHVPDMQGPSMNAFRLLTDEGVEAIQ